VLFTAGTASGGTEISSAASYAPSETAPNSILTLYAPGLSCSLQPDLLINGTSATVLYAAPGQINFAVPGTVTGAAASITADCAGAPLAAITTALSASAPAVFTQSQTGTRPGKYCKFRRVN